MRPALLFALCLAAVPALAQDTGESEPEFSCDRKNLSAELESLCAGLADGYRDVMSRPVESWGGGRPELTSRPNVLKREIVGRGLDGRKADPARDPLDTPGERGVGVRVTTDAAPVQFYTEMVQPGGEDDTILNWELKAEQAPALSGLFYGASTTGTYSGSASESVSGFAGLRGVTNPADNVRLGAEIAPRASISDLSSPEASLSFDPKLTAKSDLGRLGDSDFIGSIDANAGYNLPLDGDSSAYGGFRFTVRPK